MSTTSVRHRRLAAGLVVALGALTVPLVETARSADTPPPTSVAVAGSLQSELGCPGDWQPDCAATELTFDAGDGVWQASFELPAGTWEYKVALNDSWDENYGAGGALNGGDITLSLAAPTTVKFFYDHGTHWVTDNVGSIIATVPGSFQSELGCPGDWQPDCLRSWLQDPDGDGIYGSPPRPSRPGATRARWPSTRRGTSTTAPAGCSTAPTSRSRWRRATP
jgi:hypothetical protein